MTCTKREPGTAVQEIRANPIYFTQIFGNNVRHLSQIIQKEMKENQTTFSESIVFFQVTAI